MQLTSLTDAELLRHAHVQFDPITGTEMEAELLKRFDALIAEHDEAEKVLSVLDDLSLDLTKTKDVEKVTNLLKLADDFDAWDIRGLLDVLSDRYLDNPEALRKSLERDEAFTDLMNDLAEPIGRLHQLANPTTTE